MIRFFRCCLYLLYATLSLEVLADVTFDIKGIEDKEALDNVSVFLEGLSIPENADNESYLIEVAETSKESLTALGYYNSDVDTSVIGDDNDQVVTVKVKLGTRTKITEVDLRLAGEAIDNEDYQQLYVNFPIQSGDYLNHGSYEAAKKRFTSLAQRLGYFDAKFTKSSVEVTQESNEAIIHLWFDSGVRYQFGELVFEDTLPAEKFVRSLINFKPGDAFDTDILNQFTRDLNETGFFKSITVLPQFDQKEGRQIPLNILSYERPEDSFNAGLGFSTDEGIRGKFRWFRPWINSYGHSIEANLIASIEKQEVTATYKIPIDDPLYNYFSIQNGYKMLDQNDTDTKQYILSFNRHWRLDNDWLRTIYIRYDNESGRQGQQDFATELILPGISFGKTRSRGGINIDWGDKKLAYFEFANESLFSSADVVKVYGQTKFIRTYSGHQFVVGAEMGAILADSIYDVPSSMRFFTGGDQSIRGYGYEEIAPRDSLDYLVGGLYLATASLEYRLPIADNWKLATFTDMGTATDDFSEALSMSAGGGVVWASPVGPIRFYVAIPFTETDDSYRIHFMIGPEL